MTWQRLMALLMTATVLLAVAPAPPAVAQSEDHYGVNGLAFTPLEGSPWPDARGRGRVEYDGGSGSRSRWYGTFRFAELRDDTTYVVAVRGRYGENGSDEATAFTELCAFTTDGAGDGGCYAYFRGLERLDVVQLRLDDVDGRRVSQASRGDGPGAIVTVPNRVAASSDRAGGNDKSQDQDDNDKVDDRPRDDGPWVERTGALELGGR